MSATVGGRGRRAGGPDTRAEILEAARAAFADAGYRGATIRAIAARAGVDPALVHHYFGTKRDLFMAVVEPPTDPRAPVATVASVRRDEAGRALVRQFLIVWDGPEGARVRSLLRAAAADPDHGRLLEEYLRTQLAEPLLRAVGADRRELPVRAALVQSQLIGIAFGRHIVRSGWLVTAAHEAIVDRVGPVIQRYLTEPL